MFEDNGNKCGKCQNHDFEVLKKGHARECPFKKCDCLKCKLLDARSDILQVISGKESKLKGTKKDPHCGFCQNHGVKILRKGHVRSCGFGQERHFRLDNCFDCEVHYIRNEVNRLQIKMRRAMKEDRMLSEEQRKTAREPITREEVEKVCDMAKMARIKRERLLAQQSFAQQQSTSKNNITTTSSPSSSSVSCSSASTMVVANNSAQMGPAMAATMTNIMLHQHNSHHRQQQHLNLQQQQQQQQQQQHSFSGSSSPFSSGSPPPSAAMMGLRRAQQLHLAAASESAYAQQAAVEANAIGVTGGCMQAAGVWRPWSQHSNQLHEQPHSPPHSPSPLSLTTSSGGTAAAAPANPNLRRPPWSANVNTNLNQNNGNNNQVINQTNNQFVSQLFRIIMAQIAQQQHQQQHHNHHSR